MHYPFDGFPAEGFAFLEELRHNNNRQWFLANRQRYLRFVQAPAVELVTALGERLQAKFPGVRYDTSANGSGSLMRVNRDVRFSPDKSPYKTVVPMLFWEGSGRKMQSPTFGLQIALEGTGMMAGMFSFDKDQLERYRQAVIDDNSGWDLVQAVEQVRAAGNYAIVNQGYKKMPRGYTVPPDDRSPFLLYDGLYAHLAVEIEREAVMRPDFVDLCMTHFENMAPIEQWLVKIMA